MSWIASSQAPRKDGAVGAIINRLFAGDDLRAINNRPYISLNKRNIERPLKLQNISFIFTISNS